MRFLLSILLASLISCSDKPDPHVPWYPHHVTAWRTTVAGFVRDAGPFASVDAGYATQEDIDAAVDEQFSYFYDKLPQFAGLRANVAINDDYVIWNQYQRQWVAGASNGQGADTLWVALWARAETAEDPGDCWIARPPGAYWGVYYATWRHTARPLVPALAHELLHVAIGDPEHLRSEWSTLGR